MLLSFLELVRLIGSRQRDYRRLTSAEHLVTLDSVTTGR